MADPLDLKISQLPAVVALTSGDVVPVVSGGITSKATISSAPGVAAAILATDASGFLALGSTPTQTENSSISSGLTGGAVFQVGLGTTGTPSTNQLPAIYTEKWTGANGGVGTQDQGAGVFKTTKKTGASFVASLTGEVLKYGGTGNAVGLIGWAQDGNSSALDANSSLYGVWAYALNYYAGSGGYVHAIQADVDDRGGDAGHWTVIGSQANKAASIGVWTTVPQTVSNNATVGYGLSPNSNFTGKWHTGLLFLTDSIVPDNAGTNEAILVQGGSAAANGFAAFRTTGYLSIGIDLTNIWSGVDATHLLISATSYADQSRVALRRANGTIASPTQILSGDALANINARGHDGTNFSSGARAAINFFAAENFTSTAQGTYMTFATCTAGTLLAPERMRIDTNGNVIINTAALLTTATDGFLYIPGGAGAPTGVPTAYSGRYPLYWNTTNKKLYIYDGAWLGGTAPGAWS